MLHQRDLPAGATQSTSKRAYARKVGLCRCHSLVRLRAGWPLGSEILGGGDMNVLRQRFVGALIAGVTAASMVLLAVPAAFAATAVLPMPGERFLTAAERQAVVETMHLGEIDEIGGLFGDTAPGLVVAYTRREFTVVELPDGSTTLVPVGPISGSSDSGLSMLPEAVAGTGGKPGTDLYISVTITRTRSTSPYEWAITAYSDWNHQAFPAGMDAFNNSEDSIAVAWAGNLYIYEDTHGGLYKPCPGAGPTGSTHTEAT